MTDVMEDSDFDEWLEEMDFISTDDIIPPITDSTSAEQLQDDQNQQFLNDEDTLLTITETTPKPSHEESEPLQAGQNQQMNDEDTAKTDPAAASEGLHNEIFDGDTSRKETTSIPSNNDESERSQADQNQKISTRKQAKIDFASTLTISTEDMEVAFNSKSFTEKRMGVFFAFYSHQGTIEWRNIVKICSDDHERYPKWSNHIVNRVKEHLRTKMINEFFVCHGLPPEEEKTRRKVFERNGKCIGRWELAEEEEIIEKTKQRFNDNRKTQPKKRAKKNLPKNSSSRDGGNKRPREMPNSSESNCIATPIVPSAQSNVGSLAMQILYPKNFAASKWDDSVWDGLKNSLVDNKIDRGFFCLDQKGTPKFIGNCENMVFLLLQIGHETSLDDSKATSGEERSRRCESSMYGGPPEPTDTSKENPAPTSKSPVKQFNAGTVDSTDAVSSTQSQSKNAVISKRNRDVKNSDIGRCCSAPYVLEPPQAAYATQSPSISTDLAAGQSKRKKWRNDPLSAGLALTTAFILIVSIGLSTHRSIEEIGVVTHRSLLEITSTSLNYLSTIKARSMLSCGLNEYTGILNRSTVLAAHRSIGETTNTLVKNPSTLKDTITARGMLLCGLDELAGMSMLNRSTGTWSGFEVDLCRAVAAAIFGEDGRVNFTALEAEDRFVTLQSGNVDLIAAMATYTMERDVYEPTARAGFTFSVPFLYNGLVFAGAPRFVACAEQGSTTGNCSDVRVCVQATHVDIVKSLFADSMVIKTVPTNADFYNSYAKGLCNVLAGEQFDLAANNVREVGYNGDYSFSANVYSKEPYSLATRDDDAEWSDFVNWVFLALLAAERQNITQQTAQSTVMDPGPAIDTSDLPFYQAVATVGNYGEMYRRHLESIVPRAPVNQQNNGISPLIYSYPFGNHAAVGPTPIANGVLETILKRGHLLCGIGELEFFSDFDQNWKGFNVDYCRAISAAIFNGMVEPVFVPLAAGTRFKQLQTREIDVLLWGTTWSYDRDVYEPSASSGFTFSPPIFHSGLQFGGVPKYHECAENVNVQGECSALKICVKDKTVCLKDLRRLFPDKFILPQPDDDHLYGCLRNNIGNVIAADGFSAATEMVRSRGYEGPYQTNTKLFSGQSSAIVTRQDDAQWSSFVNWVAMATFYAEEQNITQATYHRMPKTNLFGKTFNRMLQNAIRAVGSHGEMLARNAQGTYKIGAVNRLNTKPYGPQHFPPGGLLGL